MGHIKRNIWIVLAVLVTTYLFVQAGSLEPPGPPAPTMVTLQELLDATNLSNAPPISNELLDLLDLPVDLTAGEWQSESFDTSQATWVYLRHSVVGGGGINSGCRVHWQLSAEDEQSVNPWRPVQAAIPTDDENIGAYEVGGPRARVHCSGGGVTVSDVKVWLRRGV